MALPAAVVVLGALAVLNDATARAPKPPKSKTVRGQLTLPVGWGSCVDMRARALSGGGGLRSGEIPCAPTNPDQLADMAKAKCEELGGGDACKEAGKVAEAIRTGTRYAARVVNAVQGWWSGSSSANCRAYYGMPPSGYSVIQSQPLGLYRPGVACKR